MGKGGVMTEVAFGLPSEVIAMQKIANHVNRGIVDMLRMPLVSPGTAIRDSWEQVRFPRSKKRRIRKKFSKNQDNYGHVRRMVYLYKIDNPRQSIKVEGFGLPKLP